MRITGRWGLLRAVALAACLAAPSGCADEDPNEGPDDQQVRFVVERFGEASREKDYTMICRELLADDLVMRIERVGLSCEAALQKGLGEVRDPELRVLEVRVDGDRATALVRTRATGQPVSEDRILLVRQDDGWRIAALTGEEAEGQATTPTVKTRTVRPGTTTTRTATTRTQAATTNPPTAATTAPSGGAGAGTRTTPTPSRTGGSPTPTTRTPGSGGSRTTAGQGDGGGAGTRTTLTPSGGGQPTATTPAGPDVETPAASTTGAP